MEYIHLCNLYYPQGFFLLIEKNLESHEIIHYHVEGSKVVWNECELCKVIEDYWKW